MNSEQEILLLWEAIEEMFGSGSVMQVEDYIMEKKKEEGYSSE